MAKDYEFIVVFITANSDKQARVMAEKLVAEKAAACVNITGVDSLFAWKSKTEKTKEVLLIVKSSRKLFKKIEKIVKELHNYEVPEIIALPIITGSKSYLNWIKDSVK